MTVHLITSAISSAHICGVLQPAAFPRTCVCACACALLSQSGGWRTRVEAIVQPRWGEYSNGELHHWRWPLINQICTYTHRRASNRKTHKHARPLLLTRGSKPFCLPSPVKLILCLLYLQSCPSPLWCCDLTAASSPFTDTHLHFLHAHMPMHTHTHARASLLLGHTERGVSPLLSI